MSNEGVTVENTDVCSCTVPMAEWVKKDDKVCHPCLIGPVVQWYKETLEERGKADLANDLMKTVDEHGDTEIEPICAKLDDIKEKAGDDKLKARLREFDCEVQNFAKQQVQEGRQIQ
jgi:hypothetical protein